MRLVAFVRRSLSAKVFLTYVIIIAVTAIVLLSAAEVLMPGAFERHLAAMAAEMQGSATLADDLYDSFRRALVESLFVALAISTPLAILLGLYVSRRIALPVERLSKATQRIADGHYGDRPPLNGAGTRPEALDELDLLAVNFDRMASRLQQVERMRTELMGNVAHELRTPLTSILGSMEGLIDGVLPSDLATFERVAREANRMQRLVADLQEMSRLEEGAYTLDRRPLNVEELCRAAIARLQAQYEAQGVRLALALDDGLPPMLGDEARLSQVLLNLLGNALQHTPANRQVTLSARREARMVRITVSDEGAGIAAEHLPHLFERFYRVDRSRARAGGGTGIGLTIARLLVEAHGGQISAASPGLGQGSTFSFTIPIA
jgi:histidine kinase